jgi:hypothetical protein
MRGSTVGSVTGPCVVGGDCVLDERMLITGAKATYRLT